MFIYNDILTMLKKPAHACALIQGDSHHQEINGKVQFYQTNLGTFVVSEIKGLPQEHSFLGYHIHEGTTCTGNEEDPFKDALSHYNPMHTLHPFHAGDLVPLLNNKGYAFSIFLTNRFKVNEIIGKVIIIHQHPDDLTTQPSGHSGNKIACGRIQPYPS